MGDDGRPELSWERLQSRHRGRGRVAQLASSLGLDDELREDAEGLFVEAHKAELLQGLGVEQVAAACVLLAARRGGATVYPRDLVSLCSVSEQSIRTARQSLRQELDFPLPPLRPVDCLERLVADLAVDETTREEAEHVVDRAVDAGLANGRAPEGVAAAAIYYAAPDSELQLQTVSEAAGVTMGTVRRRREEYEDLFD